MHNHEPQGSLFAEDANLTEATTEELFEALRAVTNENAELKLAYSASRDLIAELTQALVEARMAILRAAGPPG